ncbi:MAG: hypothetical protein ACLFUJ_09145 [Phycisphaerae bacterium]
MSIHLNPDVMSMLAVRGTDRTHQHMLTLSNQPKESPLHSPDESFVQNSARIGGSGFAAAVRRSNQDIATVEQADANLAEVQDLLVKMEQLARKVQSGQVEGQLPEMPEDPEAYQQVMDELAAAVPVEPPVAAESDGTSQEATIDQVSEENDAVYESLSSEKPSIGMVAKDFATMADKIKGLLEETLAADRDLLRDQVHTGVEEVYSSLDQARLSNVIGGTIDNLDHSQTGVLEARKQLDATRRIAEHQALTMTEQVQAESTTPLSVPDNVTDAENLAEKVRNFFQTDKGEAFLAAQANPGPRMAADLLANMFT